jgi:ATPase subunit of ABC transporter with duplicated ATPase domains
MAFDELKSSGITSKTPQNILLGAGTIHRGLTFTDGKWNFEESLIGATSGGTKISIVPEFKDIEVDGALVKVKGLAVKIGETATMETNMVELTPEWIKMAIVGQDGTSDIEGYDVIESKRQLEEGDYIDNFGFVGKTANGKKDIIIIFESSLCKSAFELEGKNKEASVLKLTLEAYAENQGIDLTIFLALLRKLDFSRIQFEKNMEDYSGGQKKKVLLAASLCKQAHLYIWDEPLNFIDVFSRMQIENLILEFQPTMLLVEHDRIFVDKVATKSIKLS